MMHVADARDAVQNVESDPGKGPRKTAQKPQKPHKHNSVLLLFASV